MQKHFFSLDLVLLLTFYEDSTIHGHLKSTSSGSTLNFTGLSVSNQSKTELAFFAETENPTLLFSFCGKIEDDRDKQLMFLDWIQISEDEESTTGGTFTFISDLLQGPSIINFDGRFSLFKIAEENSTAKGVKISNSVFETR